MRTKIKVLIVEDETLLAKRYKDYLDNEVFEVSDIVRNAGDAIKSVTIKNPDIVLLDIILEGVMDGIELAKNIKNLADIPFIFITGHKQSKQRAWETFPAYFILKPIDKQNLNNCIEYALFLHKNKKEEQKKDTKNKFFVRSKESNDRIDLEKILYIHAVEGYSLIFIDKNKSICYTKNIQVLDKQLCGNNLIRVHRSYIVNFNKVTSYKTKENTLLVEGNEIPVGKTYVRYIKNFFEN